MKAPKGSLIVVLGASPEKERYSNRALHQLKKGGFQIIGVNPKYKTIENFDCVPKLKNVSGQVDTLTVYVNPAISSQMEKDFIALKPRRVVFNPGSENSRLQKLLQKENIEVLEACTLVMLSTNQF